MPRVPDESLGRKVPLKTKLKDISSKKLLDYSMALVIFVVSFIEMISFFIPDSNNPAIITNKGDNYLLFWFPLFATLELFIFSLFFIFKSFRYTSCLSTKIISLMFSFVQVISLISLLISCPVILYVVFLQPILLSTIILLILINFIKWYLK